MLRRLRRQLLPVLERSGLFRLVADSRWRGNRLLILCYHGVSIADEHEWNNQLYMSPAALRERFEILKRGGYAVLPLDDALSRLRARSLPPRSVAITFDDGAYDFYARAFPILREFGFPATVYLTTYYCHFQRPVFDTGVSYALWKSGRASADLRGLVPGVGETGLSSEGDRRTVALRIREYGNSAGLSGQEKDDLLRAITRRLGLEYDSMFSNRLLHLMTPAQVREVAAAGIDMQLHTHRHRTPDDCGAFVKEIEDNRAGIEAILAPAGATRVRSQLTHFCYPSGIYKAAFVTWLRDLGIVSATTCDFGLATRADEPLLLPRLVDTGNISALEFESWLTGVAGLLPHRRRASRV